MGKAKYSLELKIKIVKEYESGKGSYKALAEKYGIGEKSAKDWVRKYRKQGDVGVTARNGNSAYSSAFKLRCVEAVLRGEGSVDDIVAKNNISSNSVLRKWIKCYNANRKLEDYDPKREVYMAEARRKTTLEEREEITAYCIAHNKDYKGTAALYSVSYSQVYSWVQKYLTGGEKGLLDRRGHHKTDEEVDELEPFVEKMFD